MSRYRIVCVDDDRDFLTATEIALESRCEFAAAQSISEALILMEGRRFDMMLLDIDLGEVNGIDLLKEVRLIDPEIVIVMVSGSCDSSTIVRAMREGANDYLTKPLDLSALEIVIERCEAMKRVRERYDALIEARNIEGTGEQILFRSDPMRRLFAMMMRLKGSSANLLISGETGTGKELLARYIHDLEDSKTRPFIAVNCAAIPEQLLEAELFGAEAGAYTGCIKRRIGKFELADCGDLFLDEIGSLKYDLQAKLLRVLQGREFSRVGGNDIIRADFRVISATNEHIEEKVRRGEFRIDLYHRLRVIELPIPPLRERTDDIPMLVEHFMKRYTKGIGQKIITEGAMARLLSYSWPGNVRELGNVVHGLSILSSNASIGEDDFPAWALNGDRIMNCNPVVSIPKVDTIGSLHEYISRAERTYIEHALRICDGDKTRTAKNLQIGRTTLYGKMKELGMEG